jgi:short-subunit dehydrogenase
MIDVNLKAPILLTNIYLKSIKQSKGSIINITSIEATKSSKFSATYSATKSGLRAFGLSLFEEVRKAGVKVVTINPDITKTSFFDDLHFKYSENQEAHLLTSDIVDAIDFILNSRDSMVVTELTVRSQKFMIEKK